MSGWHAEPMLGGIFSAGDFEEIANWIDSPEGSLSLDTMDLVARVLKDATIDAQRRKIVWEDGQALSITKSAQRIHASHPDFPLDLLDEQVAEWVIAEYVPENYTEQQMEEFEELTQAWAHDHEQRMLAKESRTGHS